MALPVTMHGSREQKPPLYAVLKYTAPSLLTLVALRRQGKTEGLFENNPAPTWCFLVATSVYCVILGGMEQIQTLESKWSQTLRRAALASGIFSIVSLVSIFIPYPVSIVPLTICIALQFVVFTWPTLRRAYSLICTGITRASDCIRTGITRVSDCIRAGITRVSNCIRAKFGNLRE